MQDEEYISYTADLLGNIHQVLSGLQGFESMAREIIQNADDAGSKQIRFSIEPERLLIWNDAAFQSCGALKEKKCPWRSKSDISRKNCDFHAINLVGSGNKSQDRTSTGRFGIGFVSVYQVTDSPTVRSGITSLELDPANGRSRISAISSLDGSEFELPWAFNPESPLREGIDASAVKPEDFSRIADDFILAAKNSLLFLRNLNSIEVVRDGVSLMCAARKSTNENRFQIYYTPEDRVEEWYIIRASAAGESEPLKEKYPALKKLDRKTDVQIALNLSEAESGGGLLFAYLPTEQISPIPCHINADFFPESNRKALVFSGEQHDRHWNEMLLRVAAKATAEHLTELRDVLGPVRLWQLIQQAEKHKDCPRFGCFWDKISEAAADCEILWTAGECWTRTAGAHIAPPNIIREQERSLTHIEISLVHESLRPFRNVLTQLNIKQLTLEPVIDALEAWDEQKFDTDFAKGHDEFKNLVEPLWSITDFLIGPDSASTAADDDFSRLKSIRFAPKPDGVLTSIGNLYKLPEPIRNHEVKKFISDLPLVDEEFKQYANLSALMGELSLERLLAEIAARVKDQESAKEFFGPDKKRASLFYKFLSGYPMSEGEIDIASVSEAPILLGHNKFLTPDESVLPSDFNDPVGRFETVDVELWSQESRRFLMEVLKVKPLTFNDYVKYHLSGILEGKITDEQYMALFNQLIDRPRLLDDEEVRKVLCGLPIVKTTDGSRRRPDECYFKNLELTELLGEHGGAWVDFQPCESKSGRSFLENLGVRSTLVLEHALDKIEKITDEPPSKDAVRKISNLFGFVFRMHEDKKIDEEKDANEISRLRSMEWLPTLKDGVSDMENWYAPHAIYQQFRAEGFASQVPVLGVRGGNQHFLGFLGMDALPPTSVIVAHLLDCVDRSQAASGTIYQILNEKLGKHDDVESIKTLQSRPCIYDTDRKEYVSANRVFWSKPRLRGCVKASRKMHEYRSLFEFLGVKEEPDGETYAGVLIDIAEEFGERSTLPVDFALTHQSCLEALARELRENKDNARDLLNGLKDYPFFLTIAETLIFPEEAAFMDNERLAEPFGGILNSRLIPYSPEYENLFEWFDIRPLSEAVRSEAVELSEEVKDADSTQTLRERGELLLWLFADLQREARQKIDKALKAVQVIRVNRLRVRSEFILDEVPVPSEPKQERAFFDQYAHSLYLDHDLAEGSWKHALLAIFSTSLPPAVDIKNYVPTADHVMRALSADEAREYLEGYDYSPPSFNAPENIEPESSELGDFSDASEYEVADNVEQEKQEDRKEVESPVTVDIEPAAVEVSAAPVSVSVSKADSSEAGSGQGDSAENPLSKKTKTKSPRTNKMRSYVTSRSKTLGANGSSAESGKGKNPEIDDIDAAAMHAVVEYEKNQGREVEVMPHKNPGYDILSRSENSGELRIIEVKGHKDEWNDFGVKLSRVQITMAKDKQEEYWLYVVEHALDDKRRKIHLFQNPFTKTDEFWFDGAWREVAEETVDYRHRFISGKKVRMEHWGQGVIVSVQHKPMSSSAVIELSDGRKKELEININSMELVED